ncbi:MerR family transcriptional regulator [Amycolatopsis nigrescens]|uniref:MerR family transcriptional regulator n=1 Tax=Amycolatopsis nigrescens TaxID=381445 RepID=UPI00037D244E|nr:MerR family transcriptional regulator [Amycolatopsis nigrescens]
MDAPLSIGDTAARFQLAVSTLHYWERRGLIEPWRRGGRRYFDQEQLYRIALIRLWRDTASMSLDDIAAVLAGRDWRRTVTARVAAIDTRITELGAAREYLSYLLNCTRDNPLTECERLRSEVRVPEAGTRTAVSRQRTRR